MSCLVSLLYSIYITLFLSLSLSPYNPPLPLSAFLWWLACLASPGAHSAPHAVNKSPAFGAVK